MIYGTQEDFEEAFSRRELEQLLADGADYDRQAQAAAQLVDGYMASRYTLPLAAVPDMVRAWALDVTRYRLWSEQAPEEVRRRYEDAMGQLRDLAAGKISLPPDANGVAPVVGFNAEGEGAERVFTMTTLADY